MAGPGDDTYCEDLDVFWWQSMRGLLDMMADARLFEVTRLAASYLVVTQLEMELAVES